MNVREIIENLILLHTKKQNSMNMHLRNYRASNASQQKRAKRDEWQRNYTKSTASRQKKAKLNEYLRNYRGSNASPQKKAT